MYHPAYTRRYLPTRALFSQRMRIERASLSFFPWENRDRTRLVIPLFPWENRDRTRLMVPLPKVVYPGVGEMYTGGYTQGVTGVYIPGWCIASMLPYYPGSIAQYASLPKVYPGTMVGMVHLGYT